MRWFEFNDLGAGIGGLGKIQCTLLADLWMPPTPSISPSMICACRGLVVISEWGLFCLRSTWKITEDADNVLMLDDEFRAGELFGWEAILDIKSKGADIESIRQKYFPSNELIDYQKCFPRYNPVCSLSVVYETSLSMDKRNFSAFSVTLFDAGQDPILTLTAQPEGRLVCEGLELQQFRGTIRN